jgi:RNA recognition motif-containing protein
MNSKLFVGNIPYDLSEADLRSVFEDGGYKLTEVKIITDKFTGKSRGFGFISFDSETDAEQAIGEFNGRQVAGRTLKVAVAKLRERDRNRPRRGDDPRRDDRDFHESREPAGNADMPSEDMPESRSDEPPEAGSGNF